MFPISYRKSRPQLLAFNLVCLLALPLAVQAQPLSIGTLQGVVKDTDRGTGHKSAFATTRDNAHLHNVVGVITGRTLTLTKDGRTHGFFLQNSLKTRDGDKNSSDGIWVFQGRFQTLRRLGKEPGQYTPKVGDEVELSARVTEYFGQTQLTGARLVGVYRTGVDLDLEVPAFTVAPPDNQEEANRYWERREGMRARVEKGSLVVAGRHTKGMGDGELFLIGPTHAVATRADSYARRIFRDVHPLDNVPGGRPNDGNGFRFGLGSQGIKAAAANVDANLPPVPTFATLATGFTGGVLYSFGKYLVQPETPPQFTPGPDPSKNAAPRAPLSASEYSVASFNMENLYDFRDDPSDGCDFAGNPGCEGVTPPYDYVPVSEAVYRNRLRHLAQQIKEDLHAPDVLLVQEVEDQDICSVTDGAMVCGTTVNGDGKPDTVQELALEVQKLGGPQYEASFDRDGADARGIVSAFLLKAGRASLEQMSANSPLFGSAPHISGYPAGAAYNSQVSNPKSLNAAYPVESRNSGNGLIYSRAPQCAAIRLPHPDGTSTLLFAINNHFASGPNDKVEQRSQQAAYGAALVAVLIKENPGALVVLGGDLNVFPRPDDPFNPQDRKQASDQLTALYNVGLFNLYDVVLKEAPAAAYSYLFGGQAQTLDHLFVTPALRANLHQVRYAHINADWPGEEAMDQNGKSRGASDHDPLVAIFSNVPRPISPELGAERPGPVIWAPLN